MISGGAWNAEVPSEAMAWTSYGVGVRPVDRALRDPVRL
jgi:hypothetical protein